MLTTTYLYAKNKIIIIIIKKGIITVIVLDNRTDDEGSNPGCGCLHFTWG